MITNIEVAQQPIHTPYFIRIFNFNKKSNFRVSFYKSVRLSFCFTGDAFFTSPFVFMV